MFWLIAVPIARFWTANSTLCAGASGAGVMVASISTEPETVCPLVRLVMVTVGVVVLAEAAGTAVIEISSAPPSITAALREWMVAVPKTDPR